MKSTRIHMGILVTVFVFVVASAQALPAAPAPDGGSSALMLAFSAAGLGALVRRFRS